MEDPPRSALEDFVTRNCNYTHKKQENAQSAAQGNSSDKTPQEETCSNETLYMGYHGGGQYCMTYFEGDTIKPLKPTEDRKEKAKKKIFNPIRPTGSVYGR